MNLKISENSWAKPALIVVLLLAFIAVWQMLAGGIMLAAFDADYNKATPLTTLQYWQHYGASSNVQQWLGISSALSFFLLAVPLALLLRKAPIGVPSFSVQ